MSDKSSVFDDPANQGVQKHDLFLGTVKEFRPCLNASPMLCIERVVFNDEDRKNLCNHAELIKSLSSFEVNTIADYSIRRMVEHGQMSLFREFYYVPGKNLRDILIEKKFLNIDSLVNLMIDGITALTYFHQKQFYHGCICVECFLTADENKWKLTVPPFYVEYQEKQFFENFKTGKDFYASPLIYKYFVNPAEPVQHDPYKSDLFSFGLVVLEAGLGFPVNSIYGKDKFNHLKLQNYIDVFKDKYRDSPFITTTIDYLLKVNEDERPTATIIFPKLPSAFERPIHKIFPQEQQISSHHQQFIQPLKTYAENYPTGFNSFSVYYQNEQNRNYTLQYQYPAAYTHHQNPYPNIGFSSSNQTPPFSVQTKVQPKIQHPSLSAAQLQNEVRFANREDPPTQQRDHVPSQQNLNQNANNFINKDVDALTMRINQNNVEEPMTTEVSKRKTGEFKSIYGTLNEVVETITVYKQGSKIIKKQILIQNFPVEVAHLPQLPSEAFQDFSRKQIPNDDSERVQTAPANANVAQEGVPRGINSQNALNAARMNPTSVTAYPAKANARYSVPGQI